MIESPTQAILVGAGAAQGPLAQLMLMTRGSNNWILRSLLSKCSSKREAGPEEGTSIEVGKSTKIGCE